MKKLVLTVFCALPLLSFAGTEDAGMKPDGAMQHGDPMKPDAMMAHDDMKKGEKTKRAKKMKQTSADMKHGDSMKQESMKGEKMEQGSTKM